MNLALRQYLARITGWSVRIALLAACGGLLPGAVKAQDEPKAKPSPASKRAPGVAQSGDGEIINDIDKQVRAKWKANKLKPSERATDYEFIRRASVDIIGRVAKAEEIQAFLHDPAETRRSLLIERLLKSEEYARNFANIWTVWLLTRDGANDRARGVYHEQMHTWLESQFAKSNMSYKELVTEILTATGKTSENPAVNYILAHLGEPIPPGKSEEEGKFTMVPVTWRTTRLFLGLQTQCAQCHPHPFNKEFQQKHFWGINAFFRQLDRKGMPMANRQADMELVERPDLNPEGLVYFEQRNGVVLPAKPVFLFDGEPQKPMGSNRRSELARFITSSKFFPKAYVNRMWAHFFGRGFTNPVDDFNEENEVSHPELLDNLASEFAHYGYDPRRLIRWICNSEAYGLTSVASKNNGNPDAEPYFSRMIIKAMSPEEIFESLIVATQADMFESAESRKQMRDAWLRSLSTSFGDDEGNEVTFNGTVVQALMMMNGNDIHKAITSNKKLMASAANKARLTDKAILDQFYLAALNRPPTAKEAQKILEIYKKAPVKAIDRAPLSFWQDVFWALLNSNEFILNH